MGNTNEFVQLIPTWMQIVWIGTFLLLLVLMGMMVFMFLSWKSTVKKRELTDLVTGIGNKKQFIQDYERLVTDKTRELYYVSYIAFDINRVNSYYGTDESEEMLRYAADIILEYISEQDCLARITGGGFAVCCRFSCLESAQAWMELVLKRMNEYGVKFNGNYVPKFQGGIYHLTTDDDNVETALYAAMKGRNYALEQMAPYVVIDESALKANLEMKELRKDIKHAIEEHNFECHLQWIVDTKTQEIRAAEVLSRWRHPQKGLLLPGSYIADMEKNEAILALDFYMLEETCRLLEQFNREGVSSFPLLCNASRKSFSLPDYYDRLCRIIEQYEFPREMLCLEITESCMFQNSEIAEKNVRQCKGLGIQIVLDDVGSGSSSFSDLANLPIDIVKFDQNLLIGASKDRGKRLLLGLQSLCGHLGIQTICEGVEVREEYELVQSLGIDFVQGFYFQKPLPVDEALAVLQQR